MKLAFTISAYRLCDFVHLGLQQLRKLSPESDILVSDDRSPESRGIESHALQHNAAYHCSRVKRGHFAGDLSSLISALVFARARGADVAVKVSQRFIFRKPESIEVIRKTFEDPNILMATPGQPTKVNGHHRAAGGFAKFTTLTDVVMIRVGAISPEELLQMYRARLLRERTPFGSFIECAVDELHAVKFTGRSAKIELLTNPMGDPIYLRRYQCAEDDYRKLALEHGWNGQFPLTEWNGIEGSRYLCKPKVV